MKRLGVIGTMVWDTIYGRAETRTPVEEWGGISYALAGLEASLPPEWEIVPLIKVGRDLARRANEFLAALTRRSSAARFIEVPEPNNRVTLRYLSDERRTERLSGGVPGWEWRELGPLVRDLDAIYLNFISGFELTLETAQHLRHGFPGPIYADLHSLLLGVSGDGTRVAQPLPHVAQWFGCFDVVQLNEQELALIGEDPLAVAATAFAQGVRVLVVTLGPAGAVYFVVPPFEFQTARTTGAARGQPIRTARVAAQPATGPLDPTGCGDVFGGTMVAQLVRGLEVEAAVELANAAAARNVGYRGATNLHYHLRGEIVPR
ncbi:MAG: carbohydrate kinase family protein [Gemmatimonadota bacterium]|nr:MAG: carbohydrate kinase family protein [Gemmatimonadota bacterium]